MDAVSVVIVLKGIQLPFQIGGIPEQTMRQGKRSGGEEPAIAGVGDPGVESVAGLSRRTVAAKLGAA
jgi:hypothetical protein